MRRASARHAKSSSARHADHDQREPGLEPHHEHEEEARGEQVEREVREVVGDGLGHALVQVHARGDLARRALRVEGPSAATARGAKKRRDADARAARPKVSMSSVRLDREQQRARATAASDEARGAAAAPRRPCARPAPRRRTARAATAARGPAAPAAAPSTIANAIAPREARRGTGASERSDRGRRRRRA